MQLNSQRKKVSEHPRKNFFGKDGAEGKKGDSAKDNPASDNIGEKPKAHPAPKVSADKSESPIAGKVK
jgi:hypothetical protein